MNQKSRPSYPRSQHIVSRFLLNRFAGNDGFLWVYEKDKLPRRSKPEKECREKDFFEFEFRGRKTNNSYESWLSEIEADAAPLVPLIMARQLSTSREAAIWATFVASIFGRTRKVRKHISTAMAERVFRHTANDDFIRQMQLDLLNMGEFHYADDLKKAVNMMRMAMDESPSFYHVTGLPNRMKIVTEALLLRDWFTVEAPPGLYFLFSDCPVVTFSLRDDGTADPGSGFGNINTVVTLPVSPTHMFLASPRGHNWHDVISPAAVRRLNKLIVQFAHQNVYSNVNSEEIKTLVDLGINQFVFGENVFVPPTRT